MSPKRGERERFLTEIVKALEERVPGGPWPRGELTV